MFTIQQIETAHLKVQSGADFPKYIQEIKKMGVVLLETWVFDSHTKYYGLNDYQISSESKYDKLQISGICDKIAFCDFLKLHHNGQTDYLTFCVHCAETGIQKWIICLEKLTCTYFDKSGNKVLVEDIHV